MTSVVRSHTDIGVAMDKVGWTKVKPYLIVVSRSHDKLSDC